MFLVLIRIDRVLDGRLEGRCVYFRKRIRLIIDFMEPDSKACAITPRFKVLDFKLRHANVIIAIYRYII